MSVQRPFCPGLTTSLVVLAILAVSSWTLILVPRVAHGYSLIGLVGMATAGTLITLGVALLLERSLRVRLQATRGALHELRDGDFSCRLGVTGRDELSATMRAVDDLAGAFQTRLETARTAERRYRLLFENNPWASFAHVPMDGSSTATPPR